MLKLFGSMPPRCSFAGPNVTLRPPRRADLRHWIDIRSKSKTFLEPWEPAWSRDALTPGAYRRRIRRVAQEWRQGTSFGFFIWENNGGTLVGGITLTNVRHGVVESGSIGYWVGEPYIRRGYGGEAVQIILDFAFRKMNLHRVEAACLVENHASRTLLIKAGFQPEGRARKYLCINGRWQDHDTFGILRTDDRPMVPVQDG